MSASAASADLSRLLVTTLLAIATPGVVVRYLTRGFRAAARR